MGSYVPNTKTEQEEMLSVIGAPSLDALYESVPQNMFLKNGLSLPDGMSELEVRQKLTQIAAKNKGYGTCLRGAGAYRHFIPAVVKNISNREEFVTAYTPYQAEISQGILQAIFEFQTMMCELTGMDVSNASVYDGATAAAEAITMCKDRKHHKAFVSATTNPQVIQTMETYCFGSNTELFIIPEKNGVTDFDALSSDLTADAAMFYLQQPNYYGLMEDASKIGELVHSKGAKFVMGVNPIACAIMETPMESGADIAVGEGQPLGLDIAFGGPYLGFMTCTQAMMRKLPGRIVGQTTDVDGKTGYVLTLSAREQHIKREKASSNICSNEELCAFTAGIYLSAMGTDGLQNAATSSMSKAHYFANALQSELGWPLCYQEEFFDEFVTSCPDTEKALSLLASHDILGGLPVENGILWCVTEVISKNTLDEAIAILKEGGLAR